MISQETIQEVVNRLVKAYNPLEIYLFGSYAKGNAREDSDLDLLVVIESSGEQRPYRTLAGLRALWDFGIPKDLLVYTKEEFQDRSHKISTIPYVAIHEGKRLYARA